MSFLAPKALWISGIKLFESFCNLFFLLTINNLDVPGSSDSKESAFNAGDRSSIPGSGRSPGEENSYPTPVFLPGESPWTHKPGKLHD